MLVYRGQMPAQMAVDSTIGALAHVFVSAVVRLRGGWAHHRVR